MLRCALIAAAFLLSLAFAAEARAEDRYRVVLLQPRVGGGFSREVLTRVRGELEASGFELHVFPVPKRLSPQKAVASAASELLPDSVLLVEQRFDSRSGVHVAEVWLSDRVAQKTFVQRLNVDPTDPSRGATWVSVQAVELVRARFADATLKRQVAPPVAKPPVVDSGVQPEALPEERPHAFAFGLGVGLLSGINGLSTVVTPLVRVSATLPLFGANAPFSFDVRISGGGLGGASEVRWEERTADVHQSFATLDAVMRFAPNFVLQPFLSIGTGLYVVNVRGSASSPYQNNLDRTYSGLGTLGTGIWAEPLPGLACVLEGQLLAAWSKTIVRLGERKVAEAGSPIGLLSVGVFTVF